MDNKITKNRLQSFLSYDWIKVIVFALIIIVAWEFIYAIISVKPTVGQDFKFYFDQDLKIVGDSRGKLAETLKKELSYDVLEINSEVFSSSENILPYRLEVYEGDVLFVGDIDSEQTINNVTKKVNRLKNVIDTYSIYCYEDLLKDCANYLKGFLKDGASEINKANLDESKIEAIFRARMKGDNRFRKEEQIKEGVLSEKKRIEDLIEDYIFVKAYIEDPANQNVFYRYTKYQQMADLNPNEPNYKNLLDKQKEENKENAIYGIDLGKLKDGDKNPSSFVQRSRNSDGVTGDITTSDGVVLTVLNFKNEQPHLQYETLTFIRIMIETYSNFTI